MTKAEVCLWKYALSKKQTGYSFKRQRSIGPYIVDFVCMDKKLIIEIDGDVHWVGGNGSKDINRQKYLESLGFLVIRFSNDDVLKRIDGVRCEIVRVFEK